MIFDFFSVFFGLIKIFFFKIIYPTRINFHGLPKMNKRFFIAIKPHSKMEIGKTFRSRNNVSFRVYNGGKLSIGNNFFINDASSINCNQKITIGNNVSIGQNVHIFDHDHDYKNDMNNFICKDIKIGNNVWIGANCVILKGISIGDNVTIAAGSIVRNSIPSNSLFYQKREDSIKQDKNE